MCVCVCEISILALQTLLVAEITLKSRASAMTWFDRSCMTSQQRYIVTV